MIAVRRSGAAAKNITDAAGGGLLAVRFALSKVATWSGGLGLGDWETWGCQVSGIVVARGDR